MKTTYLRAFDAIQLSALQSYTAAAMNVDTAAGYVALTTPVNGETLAMPIVCSGWDDRRSALGLKAGSVKGETDREAYMQGAIAALAACGLLTQQAINGITFLCQCGRLPDYMKAQAAKLSAS